MSAQPPACPMRPAQGVLDRTVRSGPGSPVLAAKTGGTGSSPETVHSCPHHRPSSGHTWSAGLASGVAPSRNAVAILHCAFCASSVGDLCMAVQHVPVGPPALSMMACLFWVHFAVQRRSLYRLCCCQNPRLSSSAKAMSRARLFGGTLSADLHRSRADDLCSPLVRRPRACLVQLASLATLACSSKATPVAGTSAFAARATAISGCTSRIGLFGASHMFDMTALSRSTADQYVPCAESPSEQP